MSPYMTNPMGQKGFRLYFWYKDGCPYCAKAHPHVQEFMKRHRADGMLIEKNLDRDNNGVNGFLPDGAPAYLFVTAFGQAGSIGALTANALERKLTEMLTSDDEDDWSDEEEDDGEEDE